MMTTEEVRAYGKVYGILNSVVRLSHTEIDTCCFEPAEKLIAAINRREKKLTPEHHERIAALLTEVSPGAVGRLSQEETGAFWLAFHQVQAPGRPLKYDERMVSKTLRVPADLWDQAAEKAGQEGLNVSEIIRRLLTDYVGVD